MLYLVQVMNYQHCSCRHLLHHSSLPALTIRPVPYTVLDTIPSSYCIPDLRFTTSNMSCQTKPYNLAWVISYLCLFHITENHLRAGKPAFKRNKGKYGAAKPSHYCPWGPSSTISACQWENRSPSRPCAWAHPLLFRPQVRMHSGVSLLARWKGGTTIGRAPLFLRHAQKAWWGNLTGPTAGKASRTNWSVRWEGVLY